ncbi:hypothetical protein HK104_001664 [Borealophlyctis nickersoniae]|nr:hypothetical protein HK104_001664 [Borealophlyctis nickersoniae]
MPKGMSNRLHQNMVRILANPEFRKVYAPAGTVLKEGQICRRLNLASTLQTIADHGVDAFYTGPIAESLVQTVQSTGGILTLADLSSYRQVLRTPLQGTYRNYQIIVPPAPSSGPIMLSMLNILESLSRPYTAHDLIEAIKFAKAQHSLFGDPTDFEDEIARLTNRTISKTEASNIAAKIDPLRTFPAAHYGEIITPLDDHGTCHIAVLIPSSDDSNTKFESVSLTTTTNMPFGSWIMDPSTGVILNDEMDDFAVNPNATDIAGRHPVTKHNWVQPGHRPLSSMSPMFVDSPSDSSSISSLVIGASGGGRIPTTLIQVLTHILDGNPDVIGAVRAPRFHHGLVPEVLEVEGGMDLGVVKGLEEKGHAIKWYNGTEPIPSLVQVVWASRGGKVQAVADDRIERIGSGQ